MDIKKNMAAKILITLLMSGLISSTFTVNAYGLEWVNRTSFKEVRRLRVINDTLFLATSGGILAVSDPGEPGREFLNTDGLGTTDITDLIVDNEGQKWVTGYGRLVKFDYENPVQYLFRDYDNDLLHLYRIVDESDHLWIGADIGLVLFSKTLFGGQIQDSYTLFGDLNPNPSVLDITVTGDSIWLATSSGLAVANKSNPSFLKAPSSWTVFGLGRYPELENDTVRSVISYMNEIYIATPENVFLLERNTDTTFVPISIGNGVSFVNILVDGDSLFYFYDGTDGGGMGVINGSVATPIAVSGVPSYPQIGLKGPGGRWLSLGDGGVYYEDDDIYTEYPHTGLPDNLISDIAVNANGLLTVGFKYTGAGQYDGEKWTIGDFSVGTGLTDLIVDSSGNAWAGTIGNGLWLITDNSLINYDENNSTLRGNSDNPPAGLRYVYIRGLATDGRYLYATCYRAVNNYPVAVGDFLNTEPVWDSIGFDDGIKDNFTVDLDYCNGYLAVGTESNGVYKYYMGGDPFDHSDDSVFQYRTGWPDYLVSDDIKVVKFDPDGSLWVGTNKGLSRYDPGYEFFVDVELPAGIGPVITAVEFDGRGSAWVGSTTGLARLNLLSGDVTLYNSLNSGLLSNYVRCLTYDKFSGRLYIGTDAGFSYLPSEIGIPTGNVEDVIAFPNPFVIRSGSDRVNFNFLERATLRIFTTAGELVRETELTSEGWDGRNQSGEPVASGVYIFVLNDLENNVGKGKILLVRE